MLLVAVLIAVLQGNADGGSLQVCLRCCFRLADTEAVTTWSHDNFASLAASYCKLSAAGLVGFDLWATCGFCISS